MLVVEVVSPESKERDRLRKPQLYAEAAIPHLWRIEKVSGDPVVYVYELDPATNTYVITGVHHKSVKLTVPFDLDVDFAGIDDL